MPLMGSLYIGASGLQTSQNALNTTAHNLSNIDTNGYTRQQVQQSDRSYLTLSTNPSSISNKQTGMGVIYSRAKQVRDYFLDKTYRKESGRSMFYEVSTNVFEEAESLLGELEGEAFENTLQDLWTAVQELAKDPCSSVTQGLLVQRASEFVERASSVYDGLSSYQDNLNAQIKQQVDKINTYGQQLLAMNDQIRAIESGGIEKANDLRDTRNLILDELAALADISYSEDAYGSVSVKIEGVDFVSGDICYEIGMKLDETTGFYTPFWPQNAAYYINDEGFRVYNTEGAEVFDLTREISTDLNTDVGGLKAMLLARGDHRADYTDITEGDYDSISQSIIMNLQAEFDQLIHNVAVKVNGILETAAGVVTGDIVLADGSVLENVKYCEVDKNGYMRNEDGSPIQMFDKIATDSYTKVTDANGVEYWVYAEETAGKTESLYSIKNLQVSTELMQNPSKLSLRLADGSEDTETAEALKAIFTEKIYTLNPNVETKVTLINYYSNLVSQVANGGYVYNSIYLNQCDTVEATGNAREQVIGVATDEELSNMIKFQNAYNASSRYINVISEMLEHIINTLGV